MAISSGAVLIITLIPAALFMALNNIQNPNNSNSGNEANRTIRIEIRPNGSVSLEGLNHYYSNGIKSQVLNLNGGENSLNLPSQKQREREPKEMVVDDQQVGASNNIVHTSVEAEPELDIPSLSTCCDLRVQNSDGLRQILTNCRTEQSYSGVKESGVWNVPSEFLLRKDGPRIFRLNTHLPVCESTYKTEYLEINEMNKNTYFMSNGFLKVKDEYYQNDEYCINGFKDDKLEVQICPFNCSDSNSPCVQKCCEYDEIYSLGMNGKRGGCLKMDPVLNETMWSPIFYSELNNKISAEEAANMRYHILHKNPASFKFQCPKKMTTVYPHGQEVLDFLNSVLKRSLRSLQFQIRKDGWLMHPNESLMNDIAVMKRSRTTKYCIDGVQNFGEIDRFENQEDRQVLFVCTVPEQEEKEIPVKKVMEHKLPTPAALKASRIRIIPKLPTCCKLDPSAEDKDSHYCTNQDDKASSDGKGLEWTAAAKFMNDIMPHSFRLVPRILQCDKWTKAFILNYSHLPGGGSPSLTASGMLKFGNDYFSSGEYCVNGIFPNIVEVLMCKVNCSDPLTPCINKCCSPDEIYSLGGGGTKRGCISINPQNGDEHWTPTLYKDMSNPLSKEEAEQLKIRPHLLQKFPPKFQYSCFNNMTLVFPYKKEVVELMSPLAKINLHFRLRRDGKIMYRHPVIKHALTGQLMESTFNNVEYCVDGVKNFGADNGPYKPKDENSVLFVCAMNPP